LWTISTAVDRRCSGKLYEALQLLAVSQRCIFILGMDLKIVANTIKENYETLSQKVIEADGNLQHGWGYKFLEKVIQTRLSVPAYGQGEVNNLINRTLGPEEPVEPSVPKGSEPSEFLPDQPKIVADTESKEDIPKDSDEVVKTVSRYGSEYFTNPRRLKRFVNNFRLHAYLANITGFEISLDRLARFLVLTEQWPGLIDFVLKNPNAFQHWHQTKKLPKRENTDKQELFENVEQLLVRSEVRHLLNGTVKDPFSNKDLILLCNWYGFRYYK